VRRATQRLSTPAGTRRFPVVIAAVVVAAVIGILIGRTSVSSADRPLRVSQSPSEAPSRRSAAVAAIEYLEALRWDVLVDDARRRRAIETRATPEAAPQLEAELLAPAEALRSAINRPPIVARTAVLGYRVRRLDESRASVRIWGMALFGTGSYEPTTQWSTSDVALVWSGARWLVGGVESRGGPTPSTPVRALAHATRDLREVRHVP
jgi:hypothetical protein